MSRLSTYLMGLILGGVITGGWTMGHSRNWVDGGPVCVVLFGSLGIIAVSALACAEDRKFS